MTSWQRRARLGVLLFGIASAAVVYFGLRDRQPVAPPGKAPRLEPKAVSEGREGDLQQVSGLRKTFDLTYSRIVTYEDGTTKMIDPRITTKNRDGRDVFVTAQQGQKKAGSSYELGGGVTLRDSAGFELATPEAVYDGASTIVQAAGAVTFSKGRMRGAGTGMSYDLTGEVLRIDDRARIDVTGRDAGSSMHSRAGSATLDRLQDLLTLDREVHVVRGAQVIDADRATARLSADEDVVTFVELRGHARVEGDAGALQSMRARDIDLDYTDDGTTLERAVLAGESGIVLRGRPGSAGRRVAAERLDAALAPDGTVTRLAGTEGVVMSLPAGGDGPARSVSSDALEGAGGAGGALTSASFSGHVVFQEEASASGRARVARSRTLALEMSDEAISSALFTGAATFEEDDLRAAAAEARYEPRAGRLALTGSEAGTLPSVADRRLRVEAQAIDIGLEKRTLDARGRVKTLINPSAKAQARGTGRQTAGEPSRLPGLFDQDQAANVTSKRLVHEGEDGVARYSGGVWLWQGEKEIRADAIDINQSTGDLVAAGAARSILVFETGRSDGQAPEIRYLDATGVITYGPVPGSRPPNPPAARLRGSQGDLTAGRIEVFLSERQVDRIEGYDAVTAKVDEKTITGHRFTYRAKGDRYEVVGTPAAPMTLRTESCQEIVGNTLTFDRSTDTMTVDRSSTRTQSKNLCRASSR